MPRREAGIVNVDVIFYLRLTVDGVRIRKSLRTDDYQTAVERKKESIAEVQVQGGLIKADGTLEEAIQSFLDDPVRKARVRPRTVLTESERSKPLIRVIGHLPVRRITLQDINRYQQRRLSETFKGTRISNRTIGMEMELLRLVLKKKKVWRRVAADFQMLPRNSKEVSPLSDEQERKLIEASRTKPEWINARCAMLLSLNTSMRACEIRGLQWRHLDLQSRTVRIERESTKTDAGARIIPLNRDAMAAVTELWHRAQVLGICEPDHYVFPACEYTHFKGEQTKDPTRHNFNPTRPIASRRSAWRSILKKAGIKNWHFHANRHQFVTKCGELGVEEEVLKSLVGHVDRKMLELYSHARLQAKRRAVEKLDEAAVTHPTDTEQSETAKTAVN